MYSLFLSNNLFVSQNIWNNPYLVNAPPKSYKQINQQHTTRMYRQMLAAQRIIVYKM